MPIESLSSDMTGPSSNRLWSRAIDDHSWAQPLSALRHLGLRWKFNAVLLPIVTVSLLLLVWMDYRHEWKAIAAMQEQHAGAISALAGSGPTDPGTSPGAVARRALAIHAIYAVGLLSVVALVINVTLWRFVLRPVDRIRERIEQMERGYWRMPVQPAAQDEVGRVVESCHMLGLKVDALVMQLLRAERLATLAVVSNKTARLVEPPVQRICAVVDHLHASESEMVREAAREIATANAEILAAVRSFSGPFEASPPRVDAPPVRTLTAGRRPV